MSNVTKLDNHRPITEIQIIAQIQNQKFAGVRIPGANSSGDIEEFKFYIKLLEACIGAIKNEIVIRSVIES